MSVTLTAELIEGFAGTLLSPMYDNPSPTPPFHRKCWELYCSDYPQCDVAAPRNHAKSTALTHVFGLATALFRVEPYIIILGATEGMAIEHLGDIATELRENDDLRTEFGIKRFVTDSLTDIVVECEDGYQFRFIARGAEQKIRGRKWRGRRPGLILGDDIEDDEQVESKDRRAKFYRWLLRAAKQALRDGGRMRLHGTILHPDSALAKLQKHPSWKSLCFRAHRSFDDFSEILWPEKFPESRLRAIKAEFVGANDAAGYSQEYLNNPLDNSDAYLRRDDFIPMSEEDHEAPKIIGCAVDWAVSKDQAADNTSMTVGGKCIQNLVHVVDQRKGRWDIKRSIEELFTVHSRWHPDLYWFEGGVIWKAIEPILLTEMHERDMWLNYVVLNPVKDKAVRGRALQAKHKAGGMRFDKEATWYPDYEFELLQFTESARALQDDQFDSTALLCVGFDRMGKVDEDDFQTEEEAEFERHRREVEVDSGRSAQTGY